MDSFPSFFKLPSSAMTSHSPFPPLKVEHRYRGVYERAGFDVCRSPLPSPNSPNFPKGFHSDVRMASSPTIMNGEAMHKSALSRRSASSGSQIPHQQSPQRRPAPSSHNYSTPDINRDLRSHLDMASLEHEDSTLSNKYRSDSTSLRDSQEKNASSSLVATSASLGCYLDMKRGHGSQAMSCEFVFEGEESGVKPRPAFDARVLLNASSGAPSFAEYSQLSEPIVYNPTSPLEETEPPVTTFYGYRLNPTARMDQARRESGRPRSQPRIPQQNFSQSHAPNQVADQHHTLYPKAQQYSPPEAESEQPLSFRRKSHPKITIDTERGRYSANEPIQASGNHDFHNHLPYPTDGSRFSYQADLPHLTPAQQFNRFQHDASDNNQLNTRSPALRHSQMSTVSSIISKGSIYDDDGEDEDVDHEMQNILRALKNGAPGKSLDNVQPATLFSDHVMGQAYSNRFDLPDITVEDMSKQVMSHQRNISETSSIQIPEKLALRPAAGPIQLDYETPRLDCPPMMQNESERELQALLPLNSLRNDAVVESGPDPSHCLGQASHDNGVSKSEWENPDPTMFIDHELENMQRQLETSSVVSSHEYPSTYKPDNEAARDLQPVSPLRPHRHSVGKGPCRACGTDFSVNARGPLKSIHSTTGELLGQWHRQCFTCSYDGCDVKFSKQVSCYAHQDMPFCQRHYHVVTDTICAWCDLGIEGECIENELKQKWHMHCLRCSMCNCMISHDYYNINGYVFCETDAQQIMHEEAKSIDGLSVGDLKVERRKTKLLMC